MSALPLSLIAPDNVFGGNPMLLHANYTISSHHGDHLALDAARLAASKLYLCATVTMLVYDHILTFADEVEHIWKRLSSLVSCLFIINRYYTLIGVMTVFFGSRGHEECVHFVSFEKWGIAIPLFIIPGIVLIIRVYALYDRNKYIALVLGLLLVGTVAIGAWEVSYPGGGSVRSRLQQIDELKGCSFLPSIHLGSRAAIYLGANLIFDLSVFTLTMIKTIRSIPSPLPGFWSKGGSLSIHNLRSCARTRFKFKFKRHRFKSMQPDQVMMYNGDPENPEILHSPIDGFDYPLGNLPPSGSDLDHPLDSPLPSCAPTPTSAFESPLIRGENHDPRDQPGLGLFRKLARDGAIYFFVISSSVCVWLFMVLFGPWQLKWMNALPTLCMIATLINRMTISIRKESEQVPEFE